MGRRRSGRRCLKQKKEILNNDFRLLSRFCDLDFNVSVKTSSDCFHGMLVRWIFRCTTLLVMSFMFHAFTSLAVMSVLVIGFQYCK